ncbi:MAG: ABC transporter permease subunit, partial [Chloroflexi bacterium]|nr:ABC transporter permease subunit [Chloroflexota bacterium]
MSQGAGFGHVVTPGLSPPAEQAAIVGEIAAQRRRNTLRFRAIFILTWIVLVGALVGWLFFSGKIDTAFIAKWGGYILGGVGITVLVAVLSIIAAIVFAILGALGRLSSNPVLFGIATLYVSLVRGTPLIVQILFIYLALP